jgi:hypothetical protein
VEEEVTDLSCILLVVEFLLKFKHLAHEENIAS